MIDGRLTKEVEVSYYGMRKGECRCIQTGTDVSNYGRAATKVRRCPPEGMAGLSKLGRYPREGVADHVTEGFPPLGNSINMRGGKDTKRLERLRLTHWLRETVCA